MSQLGKMAHLQCILPGFIESVIVRFAGIYSYEREMFTYSDGGTTALDWGRIIPDEETNTRPIMVIMPGLTSGSKELYVQNLAREADKEGY